MRLRDRWRSAGAASFPSGLEGIDREFRRQGLRARASSDRVARKGQGAELPRLSPAHPSTSIRALAFLWSPALAAWTQDLAGELASLVAQYGERVKPVTLEVRDEAAARPAVQLALDTFGRLDALLN